MNLIHLWVLSLCLLLFTTCKKEELPDAEPIAIIDESVTLNVHAKTVSSSGLLSPLLGVSITLYKSEEDRTLEDNIYYTSSTNTSGTATFTSVQIGDHIWLQSQTSQGDIKNIDFSIGTVLIKNVEVIHN